MSKSNITNILLKGEIPEIMEAMDLGKFIVITGRHFTGDSDDSFFLQLKVYNGVYGTEFKQIDFFQLSRLKEMFYNSVIKTSLLSLEEINLLEELGFSLDRDFEKEFCITILKVVK